MKSSARDQNVNLVRATQVAHEFGISRVTLWRWERDGLLPRAHRINNQKYFPRTALDALKVAAAKPGGAKAN
ncbi:MAG: helix-turn-helix domain-containing protein [Pseudomonadota bacterium]